MTARPSRPRTDREERQGRHERRSEGSSRLPARAAARDAADPPVRGTLRRALQRRRGSAASSTSTSARKPWPSACMQALGPRGRRGGHLPRARPRAGPRHAGRRRSWPRCSAGQRLQPRPRRLDAPVRRLPPLLRGQRHRRRRPAARGRAGAGRRACGTRTGVTCCFFGDGAFAEGEFHETANLAALWDLPLLFVCENNLYAMGTAAGPRARPDRSGRCAPPRTGCPPGRWTAWTCWPSSRPPGGPSDAVRAGGGPHFLEMRTYRFRAHSMYDPDRYRDKAEIERWRERDPSTLLLDRTAGGGRLDDEDVAAWRRPWPRSTATPSTRPRTGPGAGRRPAAVRHAPPREAAS